MSKIAVVLIRGLVGIRQDAKDTLAMLNLKKKHACVVVEDTPSIRGMLKKIQNVTTYGPVLQETYAQLKAKRGSNSKNEKAKEVFFLAPPIGGFERKGIKKSVVQGGALGERKQGIDSLLQKMM
ncbi:MAG: 50S ribosomal protein L30 [Candidatus Nanoarchaeia archaeon]